MAQHYKVGQAVTNVTTGYYVVVGTFNSNTTGPVYYGAELTDARKYRLDADKSINTNNILTDANYVWHVENNGTTITLKNVQDNVYFVKDNAKNENFKGTEIANLYLKKVTESADDKRYYLHLEDQNIGYIHCNQPGGDPCLSYWNADGESGTCVRFLFYEVEPDYYTPNHTGAKTRTNRLVGSMSVGNDTYTMPSGTEATRYSYTDLTATKTFTVQAGSEVALAMTQSAGSWMNAFVYVDMDKNGFTAGIANDSYTPTGDLVSYSFYNQGYNNDENGYNSAGDRITGDPRSTLALPSWTVPADLAPGEYRIRFKYDWCNINPYGDTGTYFNNTFVGHGGEIIDFTLKVVKPHTLTVTSAGWATLYLDYATYIPSGVEAYIVTAANKDYVTLTEVTDVLPANTGVIVKASEGSYTFYKSTENVTIDGNLLSGTVETGDITKENGKEYYILANDKKDGVGMYIATLGEDKTKFKNTANKAYLVLDKPAGDQLPSASLRFDFGGTTGVEEVETEVAETVIYDLTGRRVNEITKAGVYVVNGRKILVK